MGPRPRGGQFPQRCEDFNAQVWWWPAAAGCRRVSMKTRRRVVDTIKMPGSSSSSFGLRRQATQNPLFLFSGLPADGPKKGAGRVRRRGCPLAVLAVLLPPRARRPTRCRRSSVSTVPPAPLHSSSRRTRASTAPGPRLPRRGGGAAATTAFLLQCAACLARRFEGCGLLQVARDWLFMVCWLSSMA